ncbi:class II aldolase/adducin family protein [Dermatobacter hominis]|uniref:class II aldolase/adducin family protein n=1 Tax=Dermatobacter hominis TaxID=2884263 RepID=UPI001D10D9E3|nr:class II aldolase/adducin family protein [Dermatobacter hominis]UDY35063.1 class II aldolase/adducin family protein [Dermatobacter hominis]
MADVTTSPTTTADAVLAAAKEMLRTGLVEGTSGNISGRLPDGRVCLTPSSVAYETMALDDLVVVDLDGEVLDGHRSPTTEKDLHLSALRRYPELGSVVHTHAVHATMFALAHEPIPAVIEEVVVYVGGDVPCCEYRGTGTAELGEEVASRLADRGAVLLANHGLVTCGSSPEQALHHAALVERTAQIVWGARAMGAEIHPLPEKVNRDMAGVYRFMRENP